MKKRLLASLMAFCLLVGLLPTIASADGPLPPQNWEEFKQRVEQDGSFYMEDDYTIPWPEYEDTLYINSMMGISKNVEIPANITLNIVGQSGFDFYDQLSPIPTVTIHGAVHLGENTEWPFRCHVVFASGSSIDKTGNQAMYINKEHTFTVAEGAVMDVPVVRLDGTLTGGGTVNSRVTIWGGFRGEESNAVISGSLTFTKSVEVGNQYSTDLDTLTIPSGSNIRIINGGMLSVDTNGKVNLGGNLLVQGSAPEDKSVQSRLYFAGEGARLNMSEGSEIGVHAPGCIRCNSPEEPESPYITGSGIVRLYRDPSEPNMHFVFSRNPNDLDQHPQLFNKHIAATVTIVRMWDIEQDHKHDWSEAWSYDTGYHWHDCMAEGCGITANSGKSGYAAHTLEVYDASKDTDAPHPFEQVYVANGDTWCRTCGYVQKSGGGSGSGSSGGGGGSSGGGSSSVTVPVSGGGSTVQVSASVSGTTATVSEMDISKLGDASMVVVDLTGLGKTINAVQFPAAALREIGKRGGMTVKLTTVEASFDSSALDAIQSQADGQVTLSAVSVRSSSLTAGQREAVGSAQVYDLRLQSGGRSISDLKGGTARVSLPYALPMGQEVAGVVVYWLDEDANTHPCPTEYREAEKTAVFTTGHFSLYFVGQAESDGWKNPFVDVRESDWFYEAVKYANQNGLLDGLGEGRFAPNANLSRAQLAQILFSKEDKPAVNFLMTFSDVDESAWYAEAVRWAASQGIVSGYDDGRFGPGDSVTREQLALMLWRYAGSPASDGGALEFSDAEQVSDWALEAMRWAVEQGILSGTGAGQLSPRGQATRAQAAQILKNFLER